MLLLCGKSCAGKDTIQKELIKMGMQSIVSYTTRPPRKHETEGTEYHFISKDEFLEKEKQGFFAETVSYNAASGETWYYGSAVKDLDDNKVIIVNPHGLEQLKKLSSLNPISFYITAGEATIWNRLRKRGDDAAEARRRLKADDEDFCNIMENVDFAFSNDLGLSPKTIAEMILDTYNKVIGGQRNE
ncbi:MAG: guanylate kinase [Ruminococcus flavefaciens]|nr:guanylate kinase [Ruminococcus flavefaciens]